MNANGASTVRLLIADDEESGRRHLRKLVRLYPRLEIVGEAETADQVVRLVRELRPHLLFLDVVMPSKDAFDALDALDGGEWPLTIFVTAHETYAVRAFEKRAVDYLLKPVHPERLAEALDRVFEIIDRKTLDDVRELIESSVAPHTSSRIAVRTRTGTVFVATPEVNWVEADGNYVRLHTRGRSYLMRSSMGAMEDRLGSSFIRVHRSALVNLKRVKEFRGGRHDGEVAIILEDGTPVSVGKKYRTWLERALGIGDDS